MTFFEAAINILSREGKPLHYEEITRRALEEGLLSHVGRVPSEVMKSRLTAMASREESGDLSIVKPGVFALSSWDITPVKIEDIKDSEPEKTFVPIRSNERTPLTLNEIKAIREAERSRKFEQEDRDARARSRRRRRRPRKDETVSEALAAIIRELGSGPLDLQYVVDAVPKQKALPEGFPEKLEDLGELVREENKKMEDSGLLPKYRIDGDRVALVQAQGSTSVQSKTQPGIADSKKEELSSVTEAPVPDKKKNTESIACEELVSAIRGIPAEKLEKLLLELANRHSFTDAKVARRSGKGSPLYSGMIRIGGCQMRVAVRMILSGRDVRGDDVDEIRRDLDNYSAAMGFILSHGKITKGARNRAEDMSKGPVFLFDGEALGKAFVNVGLGVRTRMEKIIEFVPELLVDS